MGHRSPDAIFPKESSGGSVETLEELYEAYRDRLLGFVTTRVGNDRHTAEDIVQEAFAAAFVSIAGFQARSSSYTWLCSIAQHKIADYYRRQPQNQGSESLSLDYLASEEENDTTSSSIERWMETQETRDMVQQALCELPPTYSEVLRLKYFDGHSIADISMGIGRTPKAVEGLLARARHALSLTLSEAVHA
ncbi:MAG: RNA polymerase sigma factor [Dehalococcoidia bacterium]|nr:RNA polymerase sigma factor [Dehalococcoidia bacterium]